MNGYIKALKVVTNDGFTLGIAWKEIVQQGQTSAMISRTGM